MLDPMEVTLDPMEFDPKDAVDVGHASKAFHVVKHFAQQPNSDVKVSSGYVFRRKGYNSTQPLDAEFGTYDSSEKLDVYVSVTVRIPSLARTAVINEFIETVTGQARFNKESEKQARRASLEAQKAEIQKQIDSL